MERTTGLLDQYAARKRKRRVSSSGESDAAPIQSAGKFELLDQYAARKRKQQVSSSGESNAAPIQFADLSQPTTKDQSAADGS